MIVPVVIVSRTWTGPHRVWAAEPVTVWSASCRSRESFPPALLPALPDLVPLFPS